MFTAFYGNPQVANAYNHHPNRNPGSILGEGKILHISVYMKLLQYFITQSNDCKNSNQARQDKVKADRVAEKGDHYYRQRQCEVCGSIYWPTHSQQKFCSEKCKKINHNKKTLEFYHKKQKEKAQCKDLSQVKELVSSTNSSEITTIPA